MTEPRISNFIIALVLISLFIGVFGILIADVGIKYQLDTSQINFTSYNKLSELSAQTSAIEASTTNVSVQNGILDIVGNFFTSGYKAFLTTKNSISVYNDMKNQAFADAQLGSAANLFITALSTIVIVLIFIVIILGVILNRQL